MIRDNADYARRVKERLEKKYPETFTHISHTKIRVVLQYFTRNMAMVVWKHRHAEVTDFMNLYPNPGYLYAYRMALLTAVFRKGKKTAAQQGGELEREN